MKTQKNVYVICYRNKPENNEEPAEPWVLFYGYENVNDLHDFILRKMIKLRSELETKEFIGGMAIVLSAVSRIPRVGRCIETKRRFDIKVKPNV